MHALRLAAFFFVGTCAFSTVQAQDCSDVLSGGVFAHKNVWTNDYGRVSLAAELVEMSYEQAKSNLGGEANLPIEGIPIGGSFTSDDFNEWKNEVRQKIDYQQVRYYQNSVLLSTGDPGILQAWSSCIAQRGGFSLILQPRDARTAVVKVRFSPYPGSPDLDPTVESLVVRNGTIIDGANVLSPGSRIGRNVERVFVVDRNPDTPVLIVLNTREIGGREAYLAAPPLIPKSPAYTPVELCSCTGHGGLNGVRAWGPKGSACWGHPPWGSFTEQCTRAPTIAKCVGYGGVLGVTLWGPSGNQCAGMDDPRWGTYTAAGTPRTRTKRLCACGGRGDILSGFTLWGPEGDWCGGFKEWGTYSIDCQ